jgi:hypothetical protein
MEFKTKLNQEDNAKTGTSKLHISIIIMALVLQIFAETQMPMLNLSGATLLTQLKDGNTAIQSLKTMLMVKKLSQETEEHIEVNKQEPLVEKNA